MKSVFSICLLFTINTLAQNKENLIGFSFLPVMNVIKPENQKSNPFFHKSKLNICFSYEHRFSKTFSIYTGLTYEQKGSRADRSINYKTWNGHSGLTSDFYVYQYDYLTVPAILKLTDYFKRGIRGRVEIGNYLSLLLNETQKSEESHLPSNAQSVVYQPSIRDNLGPAKEFDLGIVLGVGFEIPVKSKMFIDLGLRRNIGLTNINSHNNGYRFMNRSFGLLFGFKYLLK